MDMDSVSFPIDPASIGAAVAAAGAAALLVVFGWVVGFAFVKRLQSRVFASVDGGSNGLDENDYSEWRSNFKLDDTEENRSMFFSSTDGGEAIDRGYEAMLLRHDEESDFREYREFFSVEDNDESEREWMHQRAQAEARTAAYLRTVEVDDWDDDEERHPEADRA
jgi:hypothetical protein